MGYLVLAVLCSLSIAVLLKRAEGLDVDRIGMLTVNYLVATVAAIGMLLGSSRSLAPLPAGLWLFGGLTGAVFISGFFVFSLATRRAGMSLSVGVMRVSVVVPVLASWLIWGERPTPMQGLGLALAGAAFFALAGRRPPWRAAVRVQVEAPAASAFLVLLLLFAIAGLSDVCLKAFEEIYRVAYGPSTFTALVFGAAFLIGAAATSIRSVRAGRPPRLDVWAWGVPLGLANLGSVEFMLRALESLPGPFAFPVNNILIVLGAATMGTTLWGERLSRQNWIGLGLAAVALVLMNL